MKSFTLHASRFTVHASRYTLHASVLLASSEARMHIAQAETWPRVRLGQCMRDMYDTSWDKRVRTIPESAVIALMMVDDGR